LFSTKTENRKAEQVLFWGVDTSGRGKDVERGCRRVNKVQILYTHVCIWKNETCLNYSRNGEREDKGE
jgi:hypothetical protein